MPIYEFKCLKCGEPAEVLQRVGDRPPACPHCGSKRMSRAVSRTSFQLKGGGWYADLYATPRPGAAKTEAAEGATVSPEAKPAAKPEGSGPTSTTPAAAPATTPAPKPEAAPRQASRPPRSRPGSNRKRR
jgi:putative FmdB family regulatory protein